jgi:hypothetical protein
VLPSHLQQFPLSSAQRPSSLSRNSGSQTSLEQDLALLRQMDGFQNLTLEELKVLKQTSLYDKILGLSQPPSSFSFPVQPLFQRTDSLLPNLDVRSSILRPPGSIFNSQQPRIQPLNSFGLGRDLAFQNYPSAQRPVASNVATKSLSSVEMAGRPAQGSGS